MGKKNKPAVEEKPAAEETIQSKEPFDFSEAIRDIKVSFIIKQGFKEYIGAKGIEINKQEDLEKVLEEFLKHNLEVK